MRILPEEYRDVSEQANADRIMQVFGSGLLFPCFGTGFGKIHSPFWELEHSGNPLRLLESLSKYPGIIWKCFNRNGISFEIA